MVSFPPHPERLAIITIITRKGGKTEWESKKKKQGTSRPVLCEHVEYHQPASRPPFQVLIQLNNHRRSRSRPLRAPSTPTRPRPVLAL